MLKLSGNTAAISGEQRENNVVLILRSVSRQAKRATGFIRRAIRPDEPHGRRCQLVVGTADKQVLSGPDRISIESPRFRRPCCDGSSSNAAATTNQQRRRRQRRLLLYDNHDSNLEGVFDPVESARSVRNPGLPRRVNLGVRPQQPGVFRSVIGLPGGVAPELFRYQSKNGSEQSNLVEYQIKLAKSAGTSRHFSPSRK